MTRHSAPAYLTLEDRAIARLGAQVLHALARDLTQKGRVDTSEALLRNRALDGLAERLLLNADDAAASSFVSISGLDIGLLETLVDDLSVPAADRETVRGVLASLQRVGWA